METLYLTDEQIARIDPSKILLVQGHDVVVRDGNEILAEFDEEISLHDAIGEILQNVSGNDFTVLGIDDYGRTFEITAIKPIDEDKTQS